jgi:cation diffusion facilitator family transporter
MEHDQRHRVTQSVTLTGAGINATLACLQIIFGFLGKSQALMTDGIHTLSDLVTDFIVLFASNRAAKAADDDHPYGHARIETFASLLLGGILILVGVSLGLRAIESVINGSNPSPEAITILFACLAVVAKESLYHYTIRAARKIHSSLLEANAWHHRSDALSSIVVVIGISAQLLGVPYMDALAAVVVAIMIILIGFRFGRKALYELIDTALDAELVEEIRHTMLAYDSVIGIHNLRSRSMGGLGYIDAHIEVESDLSVSEAHFIAHKMEQLVKREFPQIIDLQVHIDPLNDDVKESILAKLPGRSRIESDLQNSWQDIELHHQISQIKLHYLDSLIEIDIVVPASLCVAEHRPTVTELQQRALSLDYIGTVNIYYLD